MHDLPLDQRHLEELVRLCKHFNVFPMDLPSYCANESHPVGKLVVSLVQECVEYLGILTPQELNGLLDSLPPGVRMFIDRNTPAQQEAFFKRIAIYYLVAELHRKYHPIKQAWDDDLSRSEVLRIYPELRARMDRYGLLILDHDLDLMDGGIAYRDHVLHYHQFLRRGFTANPNFDFTSTFIAYYRRTRDHNQFGIAVDHRRIMPREFYGQIIELDTWQGPSFNPASLDDPNAVGLTVVKRNKDSLFELTNKLDRTEFFWSYRDGIKTFEIEEVSDIGYQFEGFYLNRYVHSERHTSGQVLRHLDGAVKVYLPDNYETRFNSHIPNDAKCHTKPKLFRIDGDIAIDDWIELIALFYKSNEMIIEYFNPEQFEEMFEERIRDFAAWKQKQNGENAARSK